MRFKKILHSPTSTNHSLNARSPLGNDERSFAVRGRSSGSSKRRSVTFGRRGFNSESPPRVSGHTVTMKHSFDTVS
jgi:hypothetical protein